MDIQGKRFYKGKSIYRRLAETHIVYSNLNCYCKMPYFSSNYYKLN